MTKVLARGVAGVLWLAACGPGMAGDEGGSTDAAGTGTTDAAPLPTTSGSTTEEVPTTGFDEPPAPACPEGQVSWTRQWELQQDNQSDENGYALTDEPRLMADGRVVWGAHRFKADGLLETGVVFVSAAGDAPELHLTPREPLVGLSAMAVAVRAADDAAIVVGTRRAEAGDSAWMSVHGSDGGEQSHVGLQSVFDFPIAMVHTVRPVVLGFDTKVAKVWVGGYDAASGEAAWELELPGERAESFMAMGPGGEVVVGRGFWGADGAAGLRAWRIDDEGAIVWDVMITEPEQGLGILGGVVVTGDGQAVLLETWLSPEPRVVARSLHIGDGSTLWKTVVATRDDAAGGDPQTGGALVTANNGLAVMIGRGLDLANAGEADPVVGSVQAVSSEGVALQATPLMLPPLAGRPLLAPLRGRCGEALVFHPSTAWLGSYAP